MKMINKHFAVLTLLFGLICLSGCTKTENSAMVAQRKSLLLKTRPEPVTTIGIAHEKIEETNQVVVEGWLDMNAFEAQKGKALVMIREILEDQDHGGEGHDPSSCPFCKRRMEAAPKAMVMFVDDQKKALPYAVTELLPVEHGDIVVIKGTAKPGDDVIQLKVSASGVFLPKKEM